MRNLKEKVIYSVLGLQALLATGVFADEAAPAKDAGGSFLQTGIMIAVALLFFYFIVLRPEKKRRKALEERRNSMKKGDRATAMGIVGIIASLQEDTVTLKMKDGSKIEVLKAAISDVRAVTDEDLKKADKEDLIEVKN
jgi:preprotein translocase subunit YajC